MLASFKKVIENRATNKTHIPDELLNVLNKDLPDGFHYTAYENGICVLSSTEKKDIKIKMEIEIPESAKKYADIIKTYSDLEEYAYRTQQKIKLNPYEDNTIIINGSRIKVSDLIKTPFDISNEFKVEQFEMIPPPFPHMQSLLLAGGDIEIDFQAKRMPYDSMSEIFICLNYKDLLMLDIILNEQHMLESKVTIRLEPKTSSAKELLKIYKFYNEFLEGNITYKGYAFGPQVDNIINEKVNSNLINYLQKIVMVENALNIEFDISGTIKPEDTYIIEQLYFSFVLKQPFKTYEKISEISGKGNFSGEYRNITNEMLTFTCTGTHSVNIFNVKLDMFVLQGIFNIIIDDMKISEKNAFKIKIKPDNNLYISRIFFLSKEKMMEYQKDKKIIEKLQKAEELKILTL